MHIVWAGEPPPSEFSQAIFLAGPTPRRNDVPSWRPECLRLLAEKGFDGVVFVPEPRDGERFADYDSQVEWEAIGLRMADAILFWVPRDLDKLPAFTTNVEWGIWHDSGKVVFGAPEGAPKNTYLKYYARKVGAEVCDTLSSTIDAAIRLAEPAAVRSGGERDIPLFIWHRDEFRSWYSANTQAGHRLEAARVFWQFRSDRGALFCWALQAEFSVADESRQKQNEFVISRLDSSAVLAFHPAENPLDTEIVIVREFRAASTASDGRARELPGGSSFDNTSPREQAVSELSEETGVTIDASRFQLIASRQAFATMLSHRIHLYSVHLTAVEIDHFKSVSDQVFGQPNESERTTVQVMTVREILDNEDIDWSQLGMIMSVITQTT